jgi:peptide/nickel transport system permease protein
MLHHGADPETIEAFNERWGLNDPLYVQYFRYMVNVLQADFGTSLKYRTPVLELVGVRIFNSLILVGPGITAAYIVGSLVGTVMAEKRGSLFEKMGIITATTFSTYPLFFLSIVLIIVFSAWIPIFPSFGMLSYETLAEMNDAPWWKAYLTGDFLHHYILPFTGVFLRYIYYPMLIMRTSAIEVKNDDFYEYHRLTGLPSWTRLRRLATHASLPVITIYPISMTRALGGLVLLEIVFNWPGIGFLLIESIRARDFPVVQFVFFIMATWVIIANVVVDLLYGYIDPRIGIEDSEGA